MSGHTGGVVGVARRSGYDWSFRWNGDRVVVDPVAGAELLPASVLLCATGSTPQGRRG